MSIGPSAGAGMTIDKISFKCGEKTILAAEGHLQKMKEFRRQVTEMQETLVNDQAQQILQSPYYEDVLKLPGLSDAFKGAAAKQIEKLQADLAAAEKKAAPQTPPSASLPSLRNYERLSGALEPLKK